MNKEIKEARKLLHAIEGVFDAAFDNGALIQGSTIKAMMTLYTALEAYKPKTVPREFLDNTLDLVSGCAAFGGGVHLDAFEEGLISLLENEDIEVEGDK